MNLYQGWKGGLDMPSFAMGATNIVHTTCGLCSVKDGSSHFASLALRCAKV